MKFINLIIILFCLNTGNVFAQNDSEAETILQSISEKYKTYESAKLNLELSISIPDTEDDIVTKGEAWLKGDMFKIEFEERMMVSNTVTQWTYLKEVNEVQISKYDPSSMIFLPSKIFDLYSDEYIYRVREEYKNSDKELIKVLELTPIDKDFEIFKMVVSINMTKLEVVKTQIFEKSGMKYAYKILEFDTKVEFEDSFFTFDPKEFEIEEDDITDLR